MNTDISPEELGSTWDQKIDEAIEEYIENNFDNEELAKHVLVNCPEAVLSYQDELREDAEAEVDKQECFNEACDIHNVDPEIARAWY